VPQRQDRVGLADEGRAPAPLPARALGEGPDGLGTGLHRHEVGARVAQRLEAAALAVAPHLGAQPALREAGPADAGGDEDVGHRVAVEQVEDLVEVTALEQAHRGGRPQHPRPRPPTIRSVDRSGHADRRLAALAVVLLGEAQRLLDERLDDLRLGDGLDDLALDEDLALAVAGRDAEVGLAASPGR
jgi:hypothetical protein